MWQALCKCNIAKKYNFSMLAIFFHCLYIYHLLFFSYILVWHHSNIYVICIPNTTDSNLLKIAEITRVLRSGGVFVGTTFLRYTSSTPWIVRPLRQVNSDRISYFLYFKA